VKKKSSKVEETKAAYPARKTVVKAVASPHSGPRFADLEKVRAGNTKLVQVHRKVLQKLAQ